MRIDKSYIQLRGLYFHAFHGVIPQEGKVGADYIVDLRVGYPLEVAMASDNIVNTLNYADLYEIVRCEMGVASQLLEHVAGRIAKAIEEAFPQVYTIDLKVTKLNPPIGADCEGAGVEIHLINDKTSC